MNDEWNNFIDSIMIDLTDMSKFIIYDKLLSSRTIEIKDFVHKPGILKTSTEINQMVKDLNHITNFYDSFETNEDRFYKLNDILNG